MTKSATCTCQWPEIWKADPNLCFWCKRPIPVDSALTDEQRKCKTEFKQLGIPWPKKESVFH